MDGHRTPDSDSSLLLRKGQPDPSTVVVMHQEVYADLRRAAVARLPGGTAGALLGNSQSMGGQWWFTVREAALLDLEFTESGLSPEPASLERLRRRVDDDHWQDLSVIGMFYADPEIGLFPSRLDIGEIHRQITPDASLMLLMNPSIDQGAFCLWREGGLLPVGGFYEALPEQSTSIIPWSGEWAGLILGAAGSMRRGSNPLQGRSGRTTRTGTRVQPDEHAVPEGTPWFDMRASSRPQSADEAAEHEESYGQPTPPEESMASEAIDRITKLAERLEVEGNLAGAVLLYRQAISLTPIVGDLVQELRLRSILHRLEEQVALLDQDITGATTVAWAHAKERAAKAEGAGQEARSTTSQAAGRQRTAVDELFELGLAAFWKGDLLHARNVLAEVVSQDPKYRTEQHRAVNLLAGIERRLALPPAPERAQPGSARLNTTKDPARTGRTLRLLLAVAFPAVALLLVLLFAAFPVAAPQAQEPHPAPTARVAEALPSTSGLAEAAPADALAAFVGANGGAARFGRALSPLMTEVTAGVTQTVAYYEYAMLAYTGEALAGSRVSVLPVGKLELERRYPQGVPAGIAPSGDQLYFEHTGFALWDSFRTNWEQPGNSAVFGQPVSGVFTETVEGAGPRIVQYFEYGAMRAAADQPGGTVLPAPLGGERFQALYGNQ